MYHSEQRLLHAYLYYYLLDLLQYFCIKGIETFIFTVKDVPFSTGPSPSYFLK